MIAYEVKNQRLVRWAKEIAALCRPEAIYWCDGSRAEYDRLMAQMVVAGSAIPLKRR